MKKLIYGILEFRVKCLKHYIENFSHLAEGQSPDVLLITCSDSRVAPNVFASTNPGDVFVLRNMGNIIPSFNDLNTESTSSEAAAIQFSLETLPIKDIIVCGHSDCGAMRTILGGLDSVTNPFMKKWLSLSCCGQKEIHSCTSTNKDLVLHNQLSQVNVLQQIAHLKTYPLIQEKLNNGTLNIHGWYFDLARGDVYNFEEAYDRFVLIDEQEASRILKRIR